METQLHINKTKIGEVPKTSSEVELMETAATGLSMLEITAKNFFGS